MATSPKCSLCDKIAVVMDSRLRRPYCRADMKFIQGLIHFWSEQGGTFPPGGHRWLMIDSHKKQKQKSTS